MAVIRSSKIFAAHEMNVLLTSVGRRAYLVNYFKEALAGRGKVLATNCHPDATGMIAADKAFVVPRADDPRFIDSLLDLCRNNKIRLLMSLHDWEAPFIAARRASFLEVGTIPAVSDHLINEMCLDKWATFEYVTKMGWFTPLTFLSLENARIAADTGQLRYPVIIKPRRGQGSVGIEVATNHYEMELYYKLLTSKVAKMESNSLIQQDGDALLVIQQYIAGTDYDIEVVNDLDGRFVSVLSKRKLASRAGECELAETVEDLRLTDVGSQIGAKLGHLGVLDVDIVEHNGILYILEFNPRFGGCYPFSHMAGANLPAAYIAWAQGKAPDPSWLQVRPGVRCFKDFQMIIDARG